MGHTGPPVVLTDNTSQVNNRGYCLLLDDPAMRISGPLLGGWHRVVDKPRGLLFRYALFQGRNEARYRGKLHVDVERRHQKLVVDDSY
jgi:hypothetical protein